MVRFGLAPARVPADILQEIRAIERLRSEASLQDITPIRPGAVVRLRKGSMKGIQGLVLSVAKERVTFLLAILGREKPVTVDHSALELA
jgi:transcription antitermination factor NusG